MRSVEAGELTLPVSERDHVLGPDDAPVTLVEYGDYECPYTAVAYAFLVELRQAIGDRLRIVYRNFPLDDIHPHAEQAAEACEAAAAQGKFWQMHALLFRNHEALGKRDLIRYAGELGLDTTRFERDLVERTHAGRVEEDRRSGEASGVRSTPTFFINGRRHRKKFDLQALLDEIAAEPGIAE